jgi:CheY-like chemotaxis protein
MTESQRSVLFIGFDSETFRTIASYAERKGYFADRVESSHDALELLTLLPFDALVLAHPLTGLTARYILSVVRQADSPNRKAGVVVVTDRQHISDAADLRELGANAVLLDQDATAKMPGVLKEITQAAARMPIRLMSRVRTTLGVVDVQSLCQTVNVSMTGMLLRGDQVIPVGSEIAFEIQLPHGAKPVRGRGRVVRHTFAQKEKVAGLGVLFLGFQESDDLRLRSFLDGL